MNENNFTTNMLATKVVKYSIISNRISFYRRIIEILFCVFMQTKEIIQKQLECTGKETPPPEGAASSTLDNIINVSQLIN